MKLLTTLLVLSSFAFSAWSIDGLEDKDFKPSKELNWQTADFGIKVSNYIYEDGLEDLNEFMDDNEFVTLQEIEDTTLVNVNNTPVIADLQASVYKKEIVINNTNKNLVVIVFRGTAGTYDIATDLSARLTTFRKSDYFKISKPMVHRGFLGSVLLFQKRLDSDVQKIIESDDTIVYLTGHSLGGSLATLYATKLVDNKKSPEDIMIYTYGAAGFANKSFVNEFKNDLYLHRIHNKNDIVVQSTNIYSRLTKGYQFPTGGHSSDKEYMPRIKSMLKK